MYKRIVLKLSGEALAGEKKGVIFDDSIIWGLIAQIKAVMAKGTQVSLVIGGGNHFGKVFFFCRSRRRKSETGGDFSAIVYALKVQIFYNVFIKQISIDVSQRFVFAKRIDILNKSHFVKCLA